MEGQVPRKVCLSGCYITEYWRSQRGKTDNHLATIEAIYWFAKEYSQTKSHAAEVQLPVKADTAIPFEQLLTIFKLQQQMVEMHRQPKSK